MQNFEGKTVREIALDNPLTTRVFEEFKIDYCCHGDTPFASACQSVGANPQTVADRIGDIVSNAGQTATNEVLNAPLTDLINYILDKHHVYTRQEIDQLTPLMAKVATRHGDHVPELLQLQEVFQRVCDDLGPHMVKEERVLFPYIEELEFKLSKNYTPSFPPFGTVAHPVNMMNIEHEEVGEMLAEMRRLTDDYTVPDWACPSFTALYHRLQAFERDLHEHIHLENNLLFPRSIEMEQKAFAVSAQ